MKYPVNLTVINKFHLFFMIMMYYHKKIEIITRSDNRRHCHNHPTNSKLEAFRS